jgi:hypothetical protein
LSRWVDDDGTTDLLRDLTQNWFERLHTEFEETLASKLTIEEKREKITEAIAQAEEETGESISIDNLAILLGTEVKAERDSSITTDKGSFIDDILRANAEQVERPNDDNEQTKGH